MKTQLLRLFLFLCFIYCSTSPIKAQCGMFPLSIDERINEASIIVEGKIIQSNSYWDAKKEHIYTAHQLEIYKLFKGTYSQSTIYAVTDGGTVGNKRQTVSSAPILSLDDIGLFMVKSTHEQLIGITDEVFHIIAGAQGVIKYDLEAQQANDVFHVYPNISNDLYPAIQKTTQTKYTIIKPFLFTSLNNNTTSKTTAAIISSFSPSTITAGTRTKLTINGSGFGAIQGSGKIGFKNADDGGNSYVTAFAPNEPITWSDTKIEVLVPYRAATGNIQVTPNGGAAATSSSTLMVTYAQQNYTDGSSKVYQADHVNSNNKGGYTWQFGPSFYNSTTTVMDAFKRAFQTWRCSTKVNWEIGANTTVDVVKSDGINVICYSSSLPSGILAACTGYASSCATGVWYIDEFDIAFTTNIATGYSWNYGVGNPASNQVDFETNCLHELGHGHQLGHVTNKADVMYYGVGAGVTKRNLTNNDLAGGNYIMGQSVVANSCGPGAMTALTGNIPCNTNVSLNEVLLESELTIFPNPTNGFIKIIFPDGITKTQLNITTVCGQVIYSDTINEETTHHLFKEIDLSSVESGIYFISVSSEKGILNKKIMIQR